MKLKRNRIQSLLLGLLLLVLPAVGQAQFTCTTNSGTITITGYTGPGRAVTIPATVNGYPVTSIGPNAFANNPGLTCVTIPASITSIGDDAFANLASQPRFYFLGNAPSLGSSVFIENFDATLYYLPGTTGWSSTVGGCVALPWDQQSPFIYMYYSASQPAGTITITGYNGPGGAVSIPGTIAGLTVTMIGEYAFSGASLTSVTIPNGVWWVGPGAFNGCGNLTNVNLPDSVLDLGGHYGGVFQNCSSLTSITIPNSVTNMSGAFYGCTSLTNVTIGTGVASIGSAFYGCTSLVSITIPNNVTIIGIKAFYGCTSLTNATMGTNVIGIGDSAFQSCSGLSSIQLPPSVTSIGNSAFQSCGSLASITIPSNVASIGSSAFAGCPLTSITLPNSVINITGAFQACPSLTNVLLGNNITSIGDSAFQNCGSLISVIIPSNVTSIGASAFQACASLPGIQIPNSVTSIGDAAFYDCSSLTNITIPTSVTSIGNSTFQACSRLASVSLPNSAASIGVSAFQACGSLATITIPDSVTSIGDHAFYGCGSLTNVTLGANVTRIGNSAFQNCNLASIAIPNSVTSIGSSAFAGCPLISLVIPNGVTSLSGVFNGCASLTSVTLPSGITSVGSYAFESCASLTTVIIPGSVTVIGDYAFYGCSNLANILIPASVTSIGNYAFNGCASLANLIIPYLVNSIGFAAFAGCPLTSLTLPNGIQNLSGLFFGCTSLTNVTIPITVTNIGADAFYGCTSLANVAIPYTVNTIGDAAFYGCSSLTNVTIPPNVTSIGNSAFQACSNLIYVTLGANSVIYTGIGNAAFQSCPSLTGIFCQGPPPRVAADVFRNDQNAAIYYFYPWANYWVGYTTLDSCPIVELYYDIRNNNGTIGINHDYRYNDSGPSGAVTIPSVINGMPVTAIDGFHAPGVTSVTIPASVTDIGVTSGQDVFWLCNNLTTFYFLGNAPGVVHNGLVDQANYEIGYRIYGTIGWDTWTGNISVLPWMVGVSGMANPSSGGAVTGGGGCWAGTNVQLTATPSSGWQFASWNDGATNNPYSITVPTSNITYTASFTLQYTFTTNNGMLTITKYSGPGGAVRIPGQFYGLPVTSIGNNAFQYCTKLTSVTIPGSVTNIGSFAFASCYSLTNVTVPNSVASIGSYAFFYCDSLASLTIPAGVTSIGDGGFNSCTRLTGVYFLGNAPSLGNGVFAGDSYGTGYYQAGTTGWNNWTGDCPITPWLVAVNVTANPPSGGMVAGGGTYWVGTNVQLTATACNGWQFTGWNDGATNNPYSIIVPPSNVTYAANCIPQYAFTTNDGTLTITGYNGPGGAATIPGQFYGLPVTSIGDFAFEDCMQLEGVTIPDSVTNIGLAAFGYCSGLLSVAISTNVISIGNDAFVYCSGLTNVAIPASVTSLGNAVFADCSQLESVTILANVTSLGLSMFLDCLQLGKVAIPNSITNIGADAFFYCPRLSNVTIPPRVTSIGDSAFSSCSSLTNVTIPASVTSLGTYGFEGCSSLTGIYFLGNAPGAGSDWSVFASDSNATVYYAPGTTGWNSTFDGVPAVELFAPSLAISAPVNSQSWSNNTFTVTGSASDVVPVSAVWCQVNASGWHLATTANGWTNWSATVSLVPGTNLVQAYALNAFGVSSSNATVNVTYVPIAMLSVSTLGVGTLSPNYSNAWLRIGQPFTMTAAAGAGFAFTNWTGGITWPLSYITNGTTLQFVMASNLMLQANFMDRTRPAIRITNIMAGTSVSNAAFTVAGVASDNWQVANVLYSLNSGAWNNAVSTNNWTNWTATVTLAPGTNRVAAYAVDPGGEASAITNASLFLVVTNQLQIHAVGLGTISPNYSNAWLEIGRSYCITSTPVSGFVAANWVISTNWLGGVATSGRVVHFTMASNLTLQVNFVDTNRPTVSITNLASGQRVSNAWFTIRGKAGDNWQVSNVLCQINGGGRNPATSLNQWSNWTAGVTLTPGTNMVQAFAVDTSGNVSLTNSVSCQFVVTNLLAVRATGWGTIAPNYSNAWLEIGRNYSITSSPAAGFVATNWVVSTNWLGGVATNSKVVHFMMAPNLTLTVNFVDVTRPTLNITAPPNGQHTTNALATIAGTAKDNWQVAGVWYQLNSNAWNLVTGTTNHYTNWTQVVTLLAGTNTLKAYAADLAGNLSTTGSVSVICGESFKLRFALRDPAPLKASGLVFDLEMSAGLSGHIEVSTNLINWTSLTTFAGGNGTITFRDPDATNSSQRFYRAVMP